MILTEKQAQFLVHLLQDTLTKNVIGYLSTTSEFRSQLLNEILNQQTTIPIQLDKKIEGKENP